MAARSDVTKQPYALLSLYERLYQEKYNKKPVINRYREKWGMVDVIDSVGFDRAKDLLEYYFRTNKVGHPITWFFSNFDTMHKMLEQRTLDEEHRKKLREQTRLMVEELEKHEH